MEYYFFLFSFRYISPIMDAVANFIQILFSLSYLYEEIAVFFRIFALRKIQILVYKQKLKEIIEEK